MLKLSRTVVYALKATIHLAELDSELPVPCSRLAQEGDMPERFLLQILRHLVTHGILRSTRGVDGGYSLMKVPEDITLLDIVEAIDGPLAINSTVLDGLTRPTQTLLNKVLDDVSSSAREKLTLITLAQLLQKK